MAVSAIDRKALRQGAFVALIWAGPFAVGSALVAANDKHSPWTAVLWLGALFGFTLGAGVASWVQEKGYPFIHGLFCAGGTYLLVQGTFTVIRLVRGASVSWLGIFFTFSTVLFAGTIGGALGSALRKRGLVPGMRGTARQQARRVLDTDQPDDEAAGS